MSSFIEAAKVGGKKSENASRFETLKGSRDPFLRRAEDYSRFTLPYVVPVEGTRSGEENQHGFQGIGAQAVNHLANKIVLTIFPPQKSFFKPELGEPLKKELTDSGIDEAELSVHLSRLVKRAQTEQTKLGDRAVLIHFMKHLIIAGNGLLYVPPKDESRGKMKSYMLRNYVARRDAFGNLLELVIKETKKFQSFSPSMQAMLQAKKGRKKKYKDEDDVSIYTRSVWKDEFWHTSQSAEDIPIGKESRVKESDFPWICVRFNSCFDEDYGRGLVEDHAGDFYALEFLSEALAKGMVLMADIKYLIKPGATTDVDHLVSSPTGEFVWGNIDDIGVLQLEKFADFTPIVEAVNEYKKRIGQAFLLNSANRRDAERVTTYELRLDAHELETSLGGLYSRLAQDLQTPYAALLLQRIDTRLKNHLITPVIITGLEALGRIGDLDNIIQYSEMMALPGQWPEAVQARVKWGDYSKTVAASLSMEIPWLMNDEEMAEEQQKQQQGKEQDAMMEAGVKAAPTLAKGMMEGT